MGVEEQKAPGRCPLHRLHEAVRVQRLVREVLGKDLALVVVADQELERRFERRQGLGKLSESFRLAPMGQVAGNDHQIGIGVVSVDVGDGGGKSDLRVAAIERLAGRYEMRVSQMDEFHGLGSSAAQASAP